MKLTAPLLTTMAMATTVLALPDSDARGTSADITLAPKPVHSKASFETVIINSSIKIVATPAATPVATPAATPGAAASAAADAAEKQVEANILSSVSRFPGV
ncbi:uncharacterized protein ACLA_068410 [Aspergillus clavatus NRRL 1]|uniref:Uncharacterized protein n=1 Tax=Aspergillus clavatus (strain ATCC 1007 / CBS 513.65 / DSM 816 / NCTC 3887 / NRRL 1 / QM 1276 / 107) TaxID=344612 RepID=A1C5Z3_ASPCL|nr:uncharacterized protein ACLA_068410 [Aspergillus clavatus NRRL 1]EAW13814.1 hypothetical protein ACLA_068410 [Aspergillus clavatus NRRL 1]